MVWKPDNPEGCEASKVRWDIVPFAGRRGLDIGCGEDKVFPSFTGVDSCIDNRLFGSQIRPDMTIADAADLAVFSDRSFDTVFSSHTLEHIVDWRGALAEWWRLVRVGGYLVLYLPHRDLYPRVGQPGANPDHKHDFAPEDIEAAMQALGGWDLVVNEVRDQRDEYSFLQVWRKRADETQTRPYTNPLPERRLALVRLGAIGDALWLSSVLPHLKSEGWHITVYTQEAGELVLRHDPNIDRIIVQPDYLFDGLNLVAYWLHEQVKYDRFVNLVGSVETRLLPTPKDFEFYWSDEVRRRVMAQNYLQTVHEWAGVDAPPRVRFYPTQDERRRAESMRAALSGRVVVLNPSGSGRFKWWPHWHKAAELIAARGAHVVVLGDIVGVDRPAPSERIYLIGREWSIRDALAFAQLANVVIGPESAIANAVSFEAMLKVVLLSHSTMENLTRDWVETVSIAVEALDCYPCHRIHTDMRFCTIDRDTRASACQASIKAEQVEQVVADYFAWLDDGRREAA